MPAAVVLVVIVCLSLVNVYLSIFPCFSQNLNQKQVFRHKKHPRVHTRPRHMTI